MGAGFAGLALASLLDADGFFGRHAHAATAAAVNPLAPKPPHFKVPARSCIFLMMNGGPSHVDTFDYKPGLAKYAGQPLPPDKQFTNSGNRKMGYLTPAWRPFQPGGQSGLMISRLLSAGPRACRQAGVDSLLPHRQPRARLGPGGDEHRQHVHRPAFARLVGRVWPGHGEPEPAGLRGDHGQARRADQRPAELVERLHAGQLPGHAVPPGRRAGARFARAAGSRGAARAARPARSSEPAAPGRPQPAGPNWRRGSPATSWPTACRPKRPRRSI